MRRSVSERVRVISPLSTRRSSTLTIVVLSKAIMFDRLAWSMPGTSWIMFSAAYCTEVRSSGCVSSKNSAIEIWFRRRIRCPGRE